PICVAVIYVRTTATSESLPLSLHDALPIYARRVPAGAGQSRQSGSDRRVCARLAAIVFPLEFRARRRTTQARRGEQAAGESPAPDRKSTRLNSSHVKSSYAVFCLKKKNRTV